MNTAEQSLEDAIDTFKQFCCELENPITSLMLEINKLKIITKDIKDKYGHVDDIIHHIADAQLTLLDSVIFLAINFIYTIPTITKGFEGLEFIDITEKNIERCELGKIYLAIYEEKITCTLVNIQDLKVKEIIIHKESIHINGAITADNPELQCWVSHVASLLKYIPTPSFNNLLKYYPDLFKCNIKKIQERYRPLKSNYTSCQTVLCIKGYKKNLELESINEIIHRIDNILSSLNDKKTTSYTLKTRQINSALLVAVQNQEIKTIVFLSKTADFNCKDDDGNTPLHIACRTSNDDLINCMLKYGALTKPNNQGAYPLYNPTNGNKQSQQIKSKLQELINSDKEDNSDKKEMENLSVNFTAKLAI